MPDHIEYRSAPVGAIEGRKVGGYAAKFNEWSKPLRGARGEFREKIAPTAFDQRGDVSLWWMHDPKQPLANTQSGTLRLTTDETGLRYEADLGDSPFAAHVLDLVQRGVVKEMSFGFRVPDGGDTWQGRDRTLKAVELREISLVEVGAYAGTSAEARSDDNPNNEERAMTLKEIQAALAAARDAETRAENDDAKAEARVQIEDLINQRAALLSRDAEVRAEARAPVAETRKYNRMSEQRMRDLEWERREEFRSTPKYKDAFHDWFSNPGDTRELITTSSSSVMIPKLYEEQIEKYIQAESVVRQLADLKTGIRGNVTLRYNTAESASLPSSMWTTEASPSTTAIDAALAEVNLPPIGGLPVSDISNWLVNSSDFDVQGEVVDELTTKVGKGLEWAYVAGPGTTTPTGLFTVDSGCAITTATSSGTTRALAVTAGATIAKLQDMFYKQLPASHWNRAVWIMPQDFYAKVAAITSGISGDTRPIWTPSQDKPLTGQAPRLLFERPVFVTEYLPTHSATSSTGKNVVCCLGVIDKAFKIREWGGMSIMRDDISLRSTGRVRFSMMPFANSKLTLKKALVQLQVTNA